MGLGFRVKFKVRAYVGMDGCGCGCILQEVLRRPAAAPRRPAAAPAAAKARKVKVLMHLLQSLFKPPLVHTMYTHRPSTCLLHLPSLVQCSSPAL